MNDDEGLQPLPEEAIRTYEGSLFQVYQWSALGWDGKPHIFEKVTRPDAVAVVPTVRDQVLLAWETQPGSKPALGFLGGRVEPGESIEAAARRELAEESGLAARNWHRWESVRPSAKVDWSVHLFVVNGICRTHDVRQPDESIQLRYYDLAGFVRAVAATDFGDPIAALPVLRVLALPGGRSALARRLFGAEASS